MASTTRSATHYEGPERRAHARIPASSVPHLTACVAGGAPVRLLDLSKRGVHLESSMHMRPGCTVAIRFLTEGTTVTITGAVVRSTVAVLETSGEVTYHTALAFTDELTLCGEEFAAAERAGRIPPPASTPPHDVANDYTMIVFDGRTGAACGGATAGPAC